MTGSKRLDLAHDVAPPRQLRDENAALVADDGRVDVLVGVLVLEHCCYVDPALQGYE